MSWRLPAGRALSEASTHLRRKMGCRILSRKGGNRKAFVERGVDALERVGELGVDEQRAGAAQLQDFDGEGDADALVAAEEHHVLHGRRRRWR